MGLFSSGLVGKGVRFQQTVGRMEASMWEAELEMRPPTAFVGGLLLCQNQKQRDVLASPGFTDGLGLTAFFSVPLV